MLLQNQPNINIFLQPLGKIFCRWSDYFVHGFQKHKNHPYGWFYAGTPRAQRRIRPPPLPVRGPGKAEILISPMESFEAVQEGTANPPARLFSFMTRYVAEVFNPARRFAQVILLFLSHVLSARIFFSPLFAALSAFAGLLNSSPALRRRSFFCFPSRAASASRSRPFSCA